MNTPYAQSPSAVAHPDIQAIIARPPARLTRWGSALLLLIVASVLASTAFIRYAERVSLPMQLAAPVSPLPMASSQALGQQRVPLAQPVVQGQLLGYTTDGADVAQVLRLAWTLGQPGAALPACNQLGSLQAAYTVLISRPADARLRAELRQQAQQWLRAHALHAPVAGRLSYGAAATTAGGGILYLLPVLRPGTEVGYLRIMQRQLRYLREGQVIQVSFEAYPASEYGTVTGQLAQMADLPDANGSYQATVTFPHGLRTSTNQQLPFRAGMRATAEVIVAYRSLLAQLFPVLAKPSS